MEKGKKSTVKAKPDQVKSPDKPDFDPQMSTEGNNLTAKGSPEAKVHKEEVAADDHVEKNTEASTLTARNTSLSDQHNPPKELVEKVKNHEKLELDEEAALHNVDLHKDEEVKSKDKKKKEDKKDESK